MAAVISRNQRREPEISFVDKVLAAWASWSRCSGIDLRPIHAGKVLGIKFVYEPRYQLPLNDDELLLVDRGIARLPAPLRLVVATEYVRSAGPQEQKARNLGLTRAAYRLRLYRAQWGIFVALCPSVELWMSRIAA